MAASCHRDGLHTLQPDIRVCVNADASVCGSPLELGNVLSNTQQTIRLAVHNMGAGGLSVTSVRVSSQDAQVAIESKPKDVGAGEHEGLHIGLEAPEGDAVATLVVASNDPDTPQLTMQLRVRGVVCFEESSRACGSDLGNCAKGTQRCAGGEWQACVGAIEPVDEFCNGEDDDCDDEIDEGELCDDAVYCNGAEVCYEGWCVVADLPGCADPTQYPSLNGPCRVGVCDEQTHGCSLEVRNDNTPCDDGAYCTGGDTCQAGACTPGAAADCSAWNDACNVGVCDEADDRCVQQPKASCACDAGVDADFDTWNECDDCDDRNGGVYPGAPELCNGIDDDCDTTIDEDYDGDLDTYSTCALDPRDYDCDDDEPLVNPGTTENCDDGLGTSTGNGIDDDCDGYFDEGCQPCNPTDTDGDSVAECDGDCAPADGQRYPDNPELCDGRDNDCNVFTVDNCDVGDDCNQDLDDNYADDPDQCRDDLLCACVLEPSGSCGDDYQCTSYCNSSVTGSLGDTCAADETCRLDLLYSANVHGCDVALAPPGTTLGGQACANDADCRSRSCARLFVGPGQKDYCLDYCGSDAYCTAAGTTCRVRRTDTMDGVCWPLGRPGLGTTPIGGACTSDTACDHGLCTIDGTSRYCTEACCQDTDCPSGYGCSLGVDHVSTNAVVVSETGPSCGGTPDCPSGMVCYTTEGTCAHVLVETVPMCLRDGPSQGARRAGAACTTNAQCASNFCAARNGVCVESCCDDSTCPIGLTCELQTIEASGATVTQARVCVNLSTDDVILRR